MLYNLIFEYFFLAREKILQLGNARFNPTLHSDLIRQKKYLTNKLNLKHGKEVREKN
jgi:hypothetical protein